MRRLICQEPNRFELEEVEMPVVKDGHALLRVKRVGVCGSDIHAYRGKQAFFSYPRVFGHELAAVIEEIPQNDLGLEPGDPVVVNPYIPCGTCAACAQGKPNCCTTLNVIGVHSDGGMAEYLTMPVDQLIKSEGLDWDQMALTECLSVGLHAVRRSCPVSDEWALIIGAGPIGMGALSFAKIYGQKTIVVDMNLKRLELCKTHFGADHVLSLSDDPLSEVERITGGDFPSVVFDATGNPASMNQAIQYLGHGGRLVFIGHHKGLIEIANPEFHKRETTLMGSRNATKRDLVEVIEALSTNKVVIKPFITHRASLEDVPGVFDEWLEPDSGLIKAMIEI